jgi:hypothetical protein
MKFIRHPYLPITNTNLNYYQTDTESIYLANKNIYGESWYFFNKKITYSFNKHGFRMQNEVDSINLDNYILFFGCSNTVGIGMALEDTFSYRVSQKLNFDYINCAVGGVSPQYVWGGIVEFLNSVDKYPKIIIINWPSKDRTFYYNDDGLPIPKIPNSFNLTKQSEFDIMYGEFLKHKQNIILNFRLIRKSIQLICKNNLIKLIEFTMRHDGNDEENLMPMTYNEPIHFNRINDVNYVNQYFARDIQRFNVNNMKKLGHPGLIHQINAEKIILDKVSK